jgi:hypothetical protein
MFWLISLTKVRCQVLQIHCKTLLFFLLALHFVTCRFYKECVQSANSFGWSRALISTLSSADIFRLVSSFPADKFRDSTSN